MTTKLQWMDNQGVIRFLNADPDSIYSFINGMYAMESGAVIKVEHTNDADARRFLFVQKFGLLGPEYVIQPNPAALLHVPTPSPETFNVIAKLDTAIQNARAVQVGFVPTDGFHEFQK